MEPFKIDINYMRERQPQLPSKIDIIDLIPYPSRSLHNTLNYLV